jgi:hypothetical protein
MGTAVGSALPSTLSWEIAILQPFYSAGPSSREQGTLFLFRA